jgi:hypothetical protein
LQNPGQTNGDNTNNERREASRTFGNKTREKLREKIKELETNNKEKYIFENSYTGKNEEILPT